MRTQLLTGVAVAVLIERMLSPSADILIKNVREALDGEYGEPGIVEASPTSEFVSSDFSGGVRHAIAAAQGLAEKNVGTNVFFGIYASLLVQTFRGKTQKTVADHVLVATTNRMGLVNVSTFVSPSTCGRNEAITLAHMMKAAREKELAAIKPDQPLGIQLLARQLGGAVALGIMKSVIPQAKTLQLFEL